MQQTAESLVQRARASSYAVVVMQGNCAYELQIPELLLVVRADSLRDGYARLIEREREVVELARSLGTLDELPTPAPPPLFRPVLG